MGKKSAVPARQYTSYKRGATDFSSQVQRLKEAGVDLVVLGAAVRGDQRCGNGAAPDRLYR